MTPFSPADQRFTDMYEALVFGVGQPMPLVNPEPGEDTLLIGFSDDFFHLHSFVSSSTPCLEDVIAEFNQGDVYYALSEPMPGIAFLLLAAGGEDMLNGVAFHQGTLTPNRRRQWQAQRPRLEERNYPGVTLPLVITLTCADTHLILAVRTIQVPISMALQSFDLLAKVHQTTPDHFLNDLHQAVAEDMSAQELLRYSEGRMYVDQLQEQYQHVRR